MSRSTGRNTMAALFLPVLLLVMWTGVVCGDEATLTLRGRLTIIDLDYPRIATSQRNGAQRLDSHYVLTNSDGSRWPLRFPDGAQLPSAGLALEIQVPAHQLPTTEDQDLSTSVRRSMASVKSRATAQAGGVSRTLGHSRRLGPLSDGHNPRQLQAIRQSDDNRLTVVSWRVLSPNVEINPESRTDMLGGLNRDFTYNDDKIIMDDVSTVIFILDMCDYGPATTKEDLERVLFRDDFLSVQSYLSSCSNNIASFRPEHVLILGPIPVPCEGYTLNTPDPDVWSATSCSGNDLLGWFDYVNIWAQDNGYEEAIRGYRHRVVITSPGQDRWMTDGPYDCTWSGMATIGPSGSEYGDFYSPGYTIYWPGVYSYAWISGNYWQEPQGWVHELGHNYYLGHANTASLEYADGTCAMGLCCTPRCFNAPHMWFLGWQDPVAIFGERDLPPGRTLDLLLRVPPPDPSVVASSSVAVSVTWMGAGNRLIWVAYREARPPFDNLPRDLLRTVSIYNSTGPLPNTQQGTSRLADLAPGSDWRDELYALAVGWSGAYTDSDGLVVQLKFCRYLDFEGQEYFCWDPEGPKVAPSNPSGSQLQPPPPPPPTVPSLPPPDVPASPPSLPSPPPTSAPHSPDLPTPPSGPQSPSPPPPVPSTLDMPLTPSQPTPPSGPGLPTPPPLAPEPPAPSPHVPSQPSEPLTPSQPTPPFGPDPPSAPLSTLVPTSPQQPAPSQPSPEEPYPPHLSPPLVPETPNAPLPPPALDAPFSFLPSGSTLSRPLAPFLPSSPSLPSAVFSRDVPIGPLLPGPPHSPDRDAQRLKTIPMDAEPLEAAVSYPPAPSTSRPSDMIVAKPPIRPSPTPDEPAPNPSADMYPTEPTPVQHEHITRTASPPVYGALPAPDEYHTDP